MAEQRMEMYRPIHETIRHVLYSTAQQLAIADFTDQASVQPALDKLEQTMAMLLEHASHEDRFVHPPLERKVPGITTSYSQNHTDDAKLFDEIRGLAAQASAADRNQQISLGNRIYSTFNTYISEYLAHLDREETELETALLDNFTDEEMRAIDQQIMESLPQERMGPWLMEICASFNPDELADMLGGFKASVPPEVAEGVLKLAESATPPANWAKVIARIS